MNTHSIDLNGYNARYHGNRTIYLGTAGSHGNEQLQVTQGKGWEGLTVQVVFHPSKVAVQLPANGLLDVPWEATTQPLTSMQGRIVFQGFDQDRLVNSTDLAYTVASHSPALGRDEEPYTPGIVEGVLNQMAADKDAILQAAQQTSQNKEAAAISAAEAAGSAADAQQSASAANINAGQAAASASQAAGSAAAAGETLTQIQTASQEAEQKIKNAEAKALDKIAAAAPALPAVSADAAWQSVTVKPNGTGYNLAALAPIEATIRPTVTGNPAVCENSVTWGLQGLKIYGKSFQNRAPGPENLMPIMSTGDGGSIFVNFTGINMMNYFLIPDAGVVQKCKISLNQDVFSVTPTTDGDIYFGGLISTQIGMPWSGDERMLFPVVPNKKIKIVSSNNYFKDRCVCFIDSNKKVISYNNVDGDSAIIVPSNATFATARLGNRYARISDGTQQTTFMVCLEEYTGDFMPYWNHQSLTISTPSALPGIPVTNGGNYTDNTGQQWICDEINFKTKTKIKRIQRFTITSESTIYIATQNNLLTFALNLPEYAVNSGSGTVKIKWFCDSYEISNSGLVGSSEDKKAGIYNYSTGIKYSSIFINDRRFSSLEDYKAWLADNPVTLIYAIENVSESSLSSEELDAYRALNTYAGTTVVSTTEPVAGLEVQYVTDGTQYAQKVQSMESRLAALETARDGI